MADLYLGLSGSEVTLPKPSDIGRYPTLPTSYVKQIDEKTMSDGSSRWKFGKIKARWTIYWGYLTWAEVVTIRSLLYYNQELRFKNEFEEDVWYSVIFISFSYEPCEIPEWDIYRVTVELKQS